VQFEEEIFQGVATMRASALGPTSRAASTSRRRGRGRGAPASAATSPALDDDGGAAGEVAGSDSDAAPVARSKVDLAALEPSKLDQYAVRQLQSAIGMPPSTGCCNQGRKPREGCSVEEWVVVDGVCQCGGSCAAGRAELQLDPALPLVNFQQQSAPRIVYQRWLAWLARRLEAEGATWKGGRVKQVLEEHGQAEQEHAERLARRRVSVQ
jgi:hypothetical protein